MQPYIGGREMILRFHIIERALKFPVCQSNKDYHRNKFEKSENRFNMYQFILDKVTLIFAIRKIRYMNFLRKDNNFVDTIWYYNAIKE